MKILTISHLFPNSLDPGFGVFVKERLVAISKLASVDIVAPIPYFPLVGKYKKFNHIAPLDNVEGVNVYHPRYLVIPKILKSMDGNLFYYSLNKFINAFPGIDGYDILDIHWAYPDGFAALKWAKSLNKKVVVTLRGNESISFFEESRRKSIIEKMMPDFDHVISVSRDLQEKAIKEYGVSRERSSVIPNGIHSEKFYYLGQESARVKCNLTPGRRYILAISRFSHEKGVNHLVKALSILGSSDVELLLIGHGPLEAYIRRIASESGVADRVRFIGKVPHEDLNDWYNAADLFCLPSLWEGCPNVVIESLASGTPVVATSVGGVPDLIPDFAYGILSPPGDPAALAEKLKEAFRRQWDRQRISTFGRSRSWDNVASQVLNIYESLL